MCSTLYISWVCFIVAFICYSSLCDSLTLYIASTVLEQVQFISLHFRSSLSFNISSSFHFGQCVFDISSSLISRHLNNHTRRFLQFLYLIVYWTNFIPSCKIHVQPVQVRIACLVLNFDIILAYLCSMFHQKQQLFISWILFSRITTFQYNILNYCNFHRLTWLILHIMFLRWFSNLLYL